MSEWCCYIRITALYNKHLDKRPKSFPLNPIATDAHENACMTWLAQTNMLA